MTQSQRTTASVILYHFSELQVIREKHIHIAKIQLAQNSIENELVRTAKVDLSHKNEMLSGCQRIICHF